MRPGYSANFLPTFLTDTFRATAGVPGAGGPPKKDEGVVVKSVGLRIVKGRGEIPTPGDSQVTPVEIGATMGPAPVPEPSDTSGANAFLSTGVSTLPGVVRFAAVGKEWVPETMSVSNGGTLADVYAARAGPTVVIVCTKVHALSKVAFLEDRVTAFRRVDADITRVPVPVPFVTTIMVTGIKRIPDAGHGAKFSLADPFRGTSGCLFYFAYNHLHFACYIFFQFINIFCFEYVVYCCGNVFGVVGIFAYLVGNVYCHL